MRINADAAGLRRFISAKSNGRHAPFISRATRRGKYYSEKEVLGHYLKSGRAG